MLEILPSVGIYYQNVKSAAVVPDTNSHESPKSSDIKSTLAVGLLHQDARESDSSIKEAEMQSQSAPSSADDKLVNWCILKHQGDIGMAITQLDHRRRGLASISALTLLQQILKEGCNCLMEVFSNNADSIKMVEDGGFKFIDIVNIVLYEPHRGSL